MLDSSVYFDSGGLNNWRKGVVVKARPYVGSWVSWSLYIVLLFWILDVAGCIVNRCKKLCGFKVSPPDPKLSGVSQYMHRYSRRRCGEFILHKLWCCRTIYRLTCPVVAPLFEPFLIVWKFLLVWVATQAAAWQLSYVSTLSIINCDEEWDKVSEYTVSALEEADYNSAQTMSLTPATRLIRSQYTLCDRDEGLQHQFRFWAKTFGNFCALSAARGAPESLSQYSATS